MGQILESPFLANINASNYNQTFCSFRVIPMLTPQLCTSPIVITTLDVLIQDWKLIQRQYEDNSSYHLTEATQGKDDPSDSAQLMPKSYS